MLSMLTVLVLLAAIGCDTPGENSGKSTLAADESSVAKTDTAVVAAKCPKTDAAVVAAKCPKTDAALVAKKCGPDCTKPCCAKTDATVQ